MPFISQLFNDAFKYVMCHAGMIGILQRGIFYDLPHKPSETIGEKLVFQNISFFRKYKVLGVLISLHVVISNLLLHIAYIVYYI